MMLATLPNTTPKGNYAVAPAPRIPRLGAWTGDSRRSLTLTQRAIRTQLAILTSGETHEEELPGRTQRCFERQLAATPVVEKLAPNQLSSV